jgi:PmbA protein
MRIDPDFADSLVSKALKGGADMAEAYQRVSRSISADAKNDKADALETSMSFGYCLRVIMKNRLGFSYSNEKDDYESVVRSALEMSGVAEADKFLDFPDPGDEPQPLEIYDSRVANITESDAIRAALEIEHECRAEDHRISKVRKASAEFSSSEMLVVNSKGVSAGFSSTMCAGHIMAIAEEGEDGQMGWSYQGGRYLDSVPFTDVGREAARRAAWMLGARKIQAMKAPVFLDAMVAAEFVSVFASMLSSEMVQKGKSLMKGREGKKVVAKNINILDDGLKPKGPGSRIVDDEGVASRKTGLIMEGVLSGYLYNTHTARKEGRNSTGNGLKGGVSSLPGVRPINLMLTSNESWRRSEEILKDLSRGLYVLDVMGMHTANPVSGDFSVGVSGLWIERGEIKYSVKESVISGNMLELFGRTEEVGSDMRFYGNTGSAGILFGETDISA